MDAFLKALQTLPEVAELISRVENGGCPAVLTGTQPVQRACVGAAVAAGAGRPMVFLCADEREARQLAGDLQSLTGETPVTLLAREWQFRPNAVSSREWERSRLAALHQMAAGNAPVVVATVDALLARTMPPHRLAELSVTLETGGRADLRELTDRLLQAGYSRCDQVEGVGQFALRGGILDVYSPGAEAPVRCEFFGDELDAMGFFDPLTQRRTENLDEAVLLPVAETVPFLHPDGAEGLCKDLSTLVARQKRRKTPNTALISTLEGDIDKLQGGVPLTAADRYMALIYPEFSTAADYVSRDAAVFFCDHGNLRRASKARMEDFGLSLDSYLQSGTLAGSCANSTAPMTSWPDASAKTARSTSIPSSRRSFRRSCRRSASSPSQPSSCPATAEVWRRRCRI